MFKPRKRKIPTVLQQTSVECGAACVAMVLGYYGRPTQLSECRDQFGVGRDGVSADAIKRLAESFGLEVTAFAIKDLAILRSLSEPVILHWQFNHFVVLESLSERGATILDPALGPKKVSLEEFEEAFTGVVLSFSKKGPLAPPGQPGITLIGYLKGGMREGSFLSLGIQLILASLAIQGLGLLLPLATKVMVDRFIPLRIETMFVVFLVLIGLLGLAQLLLSYLRTSVLAVLRARFDTALMGGFLRHLLALPYVFFEYRKTGDLLVRLNSHAALREVLTNQALAAVLDSSLILGYWIIILIVSPLLGALIALLIALQILLFKFTYRRQYQLELREIEFKAHTESESIQLLQGIGLVKAIGVERQAFEGWQGKFFRERNAGLDKDSFLVLVESGFSFLRIVSPLLVLWGGGWLVIREAMSLGDMLALSVMASIMLMRLSSLIEGAQQWTSVRVHVDRLLDVIGNEPEQMHEKQAVTIKDRELAFDNVGFVHEHAHELVLRKVSFRIKPGQSVAVVGGSGSGKTTLLKLILGLYQPTSGSVRWGGTDILDVDLNHLRRQIGVVMQDSLLFSGTIAENIAYYDSEISRERIRVAAQKAAIEKDIEEMPMGFGTLLGEKGSGVSGGQAQRLAIARALVRDPSLLVLDEATSHLDSIIESEIVHNLRSLSITRVFVAHRLSTVRQADLILVMDSGEIVEQGTHRQLINAQGHYARLVKNQTDTEEV